MSLAAAILVVGAGVAAIVGFLVLRRLGHVHHTERDNTIGGYLFSAVGLVYAVVLAFVVFAVWERYSGLEQAVTDEAAALVGVFRDSQALPEPARGQAQEALRSYVREVTTKEWASHGTVEAHRTPDLLNGIWRTYRAVKPPGPRGQALPEGAEDRLHELEGRRHARHLASEASLPWVFWPLLVGGGLITIGCCCFFLMERATLQALLTALLGVVIAAVLFVIVALNRPFTGPVPISRSPFHHAVEQFNALNL